jgi:hypothetical protein
MFALLVTAAGCKQEVGDRCNVDSDCDTNLICVRPPGGTPQSGGVCQLPGGISTDLATPSDGPAGD